MTKNLSGMSVGISQVNFDAQVRHLSLDNLKFVLIDNDMVSLSSCLMHFYLTSFLIQVDFDLKVVLKLLWRCKVFDISFFKVVFPFDHLSSLRNVSCVEVSSFTRLIINRLC